MLKDLVVPLLEGALEENPSLFLVDLTISPDNKITVTLDGDNGVTLKECIAVSRAIEHNIDRDEIDFGLEVASSGASSLLKMPRQYNKNVGRVLAVRTAEVAVEGTLTELKEDGVVLEWSAREPKPIGKGKVTVQKRMEIAFTDIIEAKVVIKF